MKRQINLALAFSLFATLAGSAANPAFDQWADQFAADWARAQPQLATRTRYFDGAEQDGLERQLTLSRGLKAAQDDAALARRGLKELKRFPESRAGDRTLHRAAGTGLLLLDRQAAHSRTARQGEEETGREVRHLGIP
jgi:hypothetical protein